MAEQNAVSDAELARVGEYLEHLSNGTSIEVARVETDTSLQIGEAEPNMILANKTEMSLAERQQLAAKMRDGEDIDWSYGEPVRIYEMTDGGKDAVRSTENRENEFCDGAELSQPISCSWDEIISDPEAAAKETLESEFYANDIPEPTLGERITKWFEERNEQEQERQLAEWLGECDAPEQEHQHTHRFSM